MKTWRCLLLAVSLLAALPAAAQTSDSLRPIPALAAKAVMVVAGERSVTLNGTTYNLSPGAQIRNEQNLIVLTHALVGSTEYRVRVLIDGNGEVSRVWMLTPGELAQDAPKLK